MWLLQENPFTKNWFLVSFYTPFGTLVAYVYLVKVLLPKFMLKREAFHFSKSILLYNLSQVLLSTWIFYHLGQNGWFGKYNYFCQPVSVSTDLGTEKMNKILWWYYFSKYTELPETVFFLMRKKFGQVNTLHVFHHAVMPFWTLLSVKYAPNGHFTFPAFLNSFVHIIMYIYYFLSAFGPDIQKHLWWKKYLTTLQLVQFFLVLIHSLLPLATGCEVPKFISVMYGALSVAFFVMFYNFYQTKYKKKET